MGLRPSFDFTWRSFDLCLDDHPWFRRRRSREPCRSPRAVLVVILVTGGALHRPTEPTFMVPGCGARIERGRTPVRVGGGPLECAERREGKMACRHRVCRKHRDIDYGSSNRVVPGCDHREISSSARPRVRGPKIPMERTTISMLAAMNANTPFGPKFSRKNAIMKLVKIVESRLHE